MADLPDQLSIPSSDKKGVGKSDTELQTAVNVIPTYLTMATQQRQLELWYTHAEQYFDSRETPIIVSVDGLSAWHL